MDGRRNRRRFTVFPMKNQTLCIFCSVIILVGCIRTRGEATEPYQCIPISVLEYECCADINLPAIPRNKYCLNTRVVPRQLALNVALKADGETVYTGKIDPSVTAVCSTFSPLCLSVNHVNIAAKEICTKLTLGPVILVKFPCLGVANDGKIAIKRNQYAK